MHRARLALRSAVANNSGRRAGPGATSGIESCSMLPSADSDCGERVEVSVGHMGVLNNPSINILGLIARGVSLWTGPRGRVRTNLILCSGSIASEELVAEIG